MGISVWIEMAVHDALAGLRAAAIGHANQKSVDQCIARAQELAAAGELGAARVEIDLARKFLSGFDKETLVSDPARSLSNVSPETAKASTPDIEIHGDPNAWECIAKASSKSQGWMKSTKRMAVPGGWLYQVTTEHRNVDRAVVIDGVRQVPLVACAEAVTFVPNPRDVFAEVIADSTGPVIDVDGRIIDGQPQVFLTEYKLTTKAAAEMMLVGRAMAGPEITALSWTEAAKLAVLLKMPGQEEPMRIIGRLANPT